MKRHYYVCAEFSKNYIRKYYYQYCDNKVAATKLLSALRKQDKTIIGWIDFVWDNSFKTMPESVLHGRLYNKTESLMKEVTL